MGRRGNRQKGENSKRTSESKPMNTVNMTEEGTISKGEDQKIPVTGGGGEGGPIGGGKIGARETRNQDQKIIPMKGLTE